MNERELAAFHAKIRTDSNGCWNWMGATGGTPTHRYGIFRADRRLQCAHRVAYEHYVKPIPAGLVIDHLCQNKLCVNPAHLEPVLQRTNLARSPHTFNSKNAAKTHCANGHEFTASNTYTTFSRGTIVRACRACKREWAARKRNST